LVNKGGGQDCTRLMCHIDMSRGTSTPSCTANMFVTPHDGKTTAMYCDFTHKLFPC